MEVLASEISSNEKSAFTEEEDDYYEFSDSETDSLDYNLEDSSSNDENSGNGGGSVVESDDNKNLKRRKRSKRPTTKGTSNKDGETANSVSISAGTSKSNISSPLVDGADILSSKPNGSPTNSSLSGSNSANGFLSDDDDLLLNGNEQLNENNNSNNNNNNINHTTSTNGANNSGSNSPSHQQSSELPLLNLFQKFLNREAIKVLQQRHSAINNRLQRLKKVVDPKKLRERGKILKNEKEKIKSLIKLKKTQLDDHMNAPPFIRLLDKCAFTLGLIILMISEFVLLKSPQVFYLWYTVLIFPLMAIRFIMYHREKYHYFMLDFCYLCQILLLFYLFGHQYILGEKVTPNLFKLVFALSNGPLAWGTIVWRNSLVFHDVDKLTSVFIHLCPPIVTYCLRWFPNVYPEQLACGGVECVLSFKEIFFVPFMVYAFWQVFYYIKTEVVDSDKLANDKEIMTSSRWMSVKQPHPIYRWCQKNGYNVSPVVILILVQMFYTLATCISLPFLIQSFWLHTVFMIYIFVTVSWNGASYYFEVFSENYSSRLNSEFKHKHNKDQPLKITSIKAFLKFLTLFLTSLIIYLKLIL
ncbi:hypothetical protein ACTFIV_009102 [Dictyostelium citrinum]